MLKQATAFVLILLCAVPTFSQDVCTLEFSTYLGGSGANLNEFGRDVSVDEATGDIYVVGGTQSADFPTAGRSPAPFDSTYGRQVGIEPHSDVVIQKYDSSGNLIWSTFYGGNHYERAYTCEFKAGFLYAAGRAGDNFPTTSGVKDHPAYNFDRAYYVAHYAH